MATRRHQADSMIKALIFSPDPRRLGGVANYLNVLKAHFTPNIVIDHFQVGQRIGLSGRIVRILFPLLDNIRLVQTWRRNAYDVVHLNPSLNARGLLRDGFFMLTLTTVLQCKKTIVFFHGWSTETEQVIRNSRFLRGIFRSIFGRAKRILVLATQFKHALISMGFDQSKIEVVTTMFNGTLFDGVTKREGGSGKTVLFLSRFIKEKGVFELLEAFDRIHARHPDLRLVLAGDGPERMAAEQWVKNQNLERCVAFTGYLRGADKARILNDSDIFILPSHEEGCPVSLLEAMAAGLAVIVTPVGGIPDIIEDGANGILLRSSDPAEIAAAIQKLIKDQVFCKQAQSRNRHQAWERYEAGVVTKEIEDIYSEVVKNG